MEQKNDEPWWAVIGPDEGESLWQPLPSRGFVTMSMTPETTPYDGFSSGIQSMPPGLEHWFRGIGKVRQPGEVMPDAFARPEGVEELMEQQRFVPPSKPE